VYYYIIRDGALNCYCCYGLQLQVLAATYITRQSISVALHYYSCTLYHWMYVNLVAVSDENAAATATAYKRKRVAAVVAVVVVCVLP
jgi:hypothetical protein